MDFFDITSGKQTNKKPSYISYLCIPV